MAKFPCDKCKREYLENELIFFIIDEKIEYPDDSVVCVCKKCKKEIEEGQNAYISNSK